MENIEIVSEKNSILANFLASKLNKNLINFKSFEFADSESYITIEDKSKIIEKNIIVIYQFSFNKEKIDNQVFKLFLLLDLIKKIGSKKIYLILPYLPYSRQDKTFDGQYIGPINLLGKIFKILNIENILTLDLHEVAVKEIFVNNLSIINLNNYWISFLKNLIEKNKNNFSIVSPDYGRIENNQKIAQALNLDFCYIEKKRINPDQSISLNLNGNIKNKTAIIIDDIIDTGKTAINSIQILLKNGANKVYGCFTHSIFANDSFSKIVNSNFDKIFITNSIKINQDILNNNKINLLSIDNLVFENIKDFINGKL